MAKRSKRTISKPSRDSIQTEVTRLLTQMQHGHHSAGTAIERLGKKFPEDPYVLNALGCLNLERGRAHMALDYFEKSALRGYTKRDEQRRNIFLSLAMKGELDRFCDLWSELSEKIQTTSHDTEKKLQHEISLLKSALKAARATANVNIVKKCLTLWKEREPNSSALTLAYVTTLLTNGDKDTAIDALKKIPPIDRDNVPELLQAAELCYKLRLSASLKYFSKACEVLQLSHYSNDIPSANLFQRAITIGTNLSQFEKAASLMEILLSLHPELSESKLYDRLNIHQQANHWENVEQLVPEYLNAVRTDRIKPKGLFRHLSLPGLTDADHLELANAYQKTLKTPVELETSYNPNRQPRTGRQLRIGFLSADFRQHPVAQLVVEVFERINRSKFSVIGYDLADEQPSLLRTRILEALDEVVHARTLSDEELTETILKDEIDILVDLQGDTSDTRVWLMRQRLAPIHVGWLGFPGTLGSGVNDYIIADKHVIPKDSFLNFAEAPVWLPTTYIPNDPERQPLQTPPRVTQDLPDNAIVFCCFNGQYKITKEIFHAWCRILQQVDGSVLWLRKETDAVVQYFCDVASTFGINPDRLIFAPRTQTQIDHLTRLQCADIALDTRPYNAHTTTIDALWAKVPTITLPGDTFASRVAASILHAADLEQFIAIDIDDYVDKAIRLAKDEEKRKTLRIYLSNLRETSPLYNSNIFVSGLEAAFEAMYAQYEQGLAPQPILKLKHASDIQLCEMLKHSNIKQLSQMSTSLLLEKAQTLLNKEELQQAQSLYEEVINRTPDQFEACMGLGLVYSVAGHYERALGWFEKAQSLDQKHQHVIDNIKKVKEKISSNNAENIKFFLFNGQKFHQNGDLDTAMSHYQKVLELSPKHPTALHYTGLIEVQLGNCSGLEYIKESLKIQPNNEIFLANYTVAKKRCQQSSESR